MTVTFKYNGKQYTTNNLEKKLLKLGISKEDIELLGNQYRIVEIEETDKEQVIVRSTKDNIRRICYVLKGTRPPISTLFEKQRSIYADEFLKTMYYE